MKTRNEIINKTLELNELLKKKRDNIKLAGGQNSDLANEPLFNQIQALKWVLCLDEEE